MIDLQPLSCMGMQAYLQKMLPGSQCQIAYSKETIETLQLRPELDLVILGLNREPGEVTSYLKEKVLAAGPGLPVIILYEVFEIEYLRQFAGHTTTGFLAKDKVADQVVDCIKSVISGSSFMCEKTNQHVINAFTGRRPPTRKYTKRLT